METFPPPASDTVTWDTSRQDSQFICADRSRARHQRIQIGCAKSRDPEEMAGSLVHEAIHYLQHMTHPIKMSRLGSSRVPYLQNPIELEADAFEFSFRYGDNDVYDKEVTRLLFPHWKAIAKHHSLPFAATVE
jgi:hypothetical protein